MSNSIYKLLEDGGYFTNRSMSVQLKYSEHYHINSLFNLGMCRKSIANKLNLLYTNVCGIIKNNRNYIK